MRTVNGGRERPGRWKVVLRLLPAVSALLGLDARAQPSSDAGFNLHNHTYCSDGADTPETVARLAKKAGVRALSITDHDSVDCLDRARSEADKLGLRLIPGV
ncbi:MAG: PHP domain-containing protein, partial [Elusimicrobiota bacterium]